MGYNRFGAGANGGSAGDGELPAEEETVHALLGPAERLLREGASAVALVAELIAVVIIALAVVMAVWRTARHFLGRVHAPMDRVRLDLARSLALALEFLLAADVVRTAVAPNWDDIAKLAAVAVIRTGLNYFLHRDIVEVETEARGTAFTEPQEPAQEGR